MFKKLFLVVMVAASVVFSFDMAQAYVGNPTPGLARADLDGLESGIKFPEIYLNPGALGDALIYGYYNARGSYNFIRVVNTSSHYGVSAKVRIREGRNSNELLDFYICLSAMDQWTGWIIGADDNGATPAYLMWYDSDTPTFPDPTGTGVGDDDVTNNVGAYKNLKYFATGAAASVTMDDTKEGYYEILGVNAWPDTAGDSKVVKTPHQCGRVVLDDLSGSNEWTALGITPNGIESGTAACGNDPTIPCYIYDAPNTLFGVSYLFDFKTFPKTFAYNASALANFRYILGGGAYTNATAALKGSLGIDSPPTLVNADDGLEAVNFTLTKTREYATYDIEAWLTGNTTTIINTFPTKMLSIREDQGLGFFFANSLPNGPFNDNAVYSDPRNIPAGDGHVHGTPGHDATGSVEGSGTDAERCDEILVVIWDDKEHSPSAQPCDFSPCAPTHVTYKKCDEVSLFVVGSGNSSPLTEANDPADTRGTLVNGNIDASTFTIGWLYEDFSRDGAGNLVIGRRSRVTNFPSTSYSYALGMPVISYELQTFAGFIMDHMLPLRYETDVCSSLKQCGGLNFIIE